MRIQLELYASLMKHLPNNADKHRAYVEITEESTPHQLLDKFAVPREQAHLILRNGVYLHPEQRDTACMQDGDVIAAWPPVAGG